MPRVLPPTQDSLSTQTLGGPLPARPDPGSPQFLGPHSPRLPASLTLCLHLLEPRGARWTFFIYRETYFKYTYYILDVYIFYTLYFMYIFYVYFYTYLYVCVYT